MLAERGAAKEAEPFLETAAEAGDTGAAALLGKLLRERAERWLSSATNGGSGEAAHLLGDLQLGSGALDDAFDSYLQAVDAGYAPVAASMARVNQLWNDNESAVVWLRRAADTGDVWAASELAGYEHKEDHTERNRVESVHMALDDVLYGAERGRALDATNLGVLLERRARPDEARPWYLKGYEQGDAYGAFRLAELHKKDGDEAEARSWYRKAAAMGHPGPSGRWGIGRVAPRGRPARRTCWSAGRDPSSPRRGGAAPFGERPQRSRGADRAVPCVEPVGSDGTRAVPLGGCPVGES
ncbi:hypothetical protein O1L55_17415 [Streptomyces albulus]|nr:hypothetical protein [Streptomyces noursei]